MSLGRAEVLIRQANRYIDAGDIETAKSRLRDARDELRTHVGAGLDSEEQKLKDALVAAFYEATFRLPGESLDGLDGLAGGVPYSKRPRPPKATHCTTPEEHCTKPVFSKGLCKTHYHRAYLAQNRAKRVEQRRHSRGGKRP